MGIASVINNALAQVKLICDNYGTASVGVGRYRVGNFPIILVSPGRTDKGLEAMSGRLSEHDLLTINFDIIVLVKDTEPADWATEVITTMGSIFDAIENNPTLGATVEDCYGVFLEPARLSITGLEGPAQKIYYGGMMSFKALAFYPQ